MLILQSFIDTHPPDPRVRPVDDTEVSRYVGILPAALLELWKESGVGFYGNGLIQLIIPSSYQFALAGWLMQEESDPNRVPIALSGFGRLFYFRKLNDSGDVDVCYIDPHDSSVVVLTWSLEEFFNETLCAPAGIAGILEADALRKATQKVGPLEANEMYGYAPALRMGGKKTTDHVIRVHAPVHLELLLQMALAG